MNYFPRSTSPDRAFPANRSRRLSSANSSSFSVIIPPQYPRSNSSASSDSGYVDNVPYDPYSIESHFPAARSGRQRNTDPIVLQRVQEVTTLVEQALSGISYENLDISAEVKEQVELVLTQFIEAKGRADAPHDELFKYLVHAAENFEKVSMMLKKIKDFMLKANPNLDAQTSSVSTGQLVLQDPNGKKEELRSRAKGLKILGEIFQRTKPGNGTENDPFVRTGMHKLNGNEPSYDGASTSPISSKFSEPSHLAFEPQSPYVEPPSFAGAEFNYHFPMPTNPPGIKRHTSTGKNL